MFRTTGDVRIDIVLAQGIAQSAHTPCDIGLAIRTPLVQQRGDALVGFRLQIAERQILQFPFQLPDAQTVGERRVDVGGEFGQRAAFLLLSAGCRPQQGKLARQQQIHHAQVADDRQ